MQSTLTVEQARAEIVARIVTLAAERIALEDALDRVLARDIRSPIDLPPFDNSAMDGYALQHEDSAAAPVSLPVSADIYAGDSPAPLQLGTAARIMTGAALPAGASAVIPIEDTGDDWRERQLSPLPATVQILRRLRAGENVRFVGENIRQGELVAAAATVLGPAEIGMLAGLGCSEISVIRQPRVVILSSGDELVDLHEPLEPGKIRDSNSYTLAAMLGRAGALPTRLPAAADSLQAIRELYQHALSLAPDMIISSAGVSVGAADLVRTVLSELGEIDFWRINMRPGKPLAFGHIARLPFFGLPGNPVSAMVTFEVLVKPALAKMAGRRLVQRELRAVLAHDMRSDGRRSYMRVRLTRDGGGLVARATGIQSSGALMSMVLADGLAIIPAGQTFLAAGTELAVLPLRDLA